MKVTLFSCGPAANESELLAYKQLETRIQSVPGDGEWVLLTNLAFSVTHHLQSDEIDVVAIGPPGVRVLEIKHWTSQWAENHPELVVHESEKVSDKSRKIGTTLRKLIPDLPRVDGTILLTQEASKIRRLSGQEIRGVAFYSLTDWKTALGLELPTRLTPTQVRLLGKSLEPKSAVAFDGSIRRLAGYVNLELDTPKENRFHRVYRGIHSTRQDRVVLHLYDLSVRDEVNAEARARREFEALLQLQLHPWAPRILDSFQDVPGYSGEMFFFTLVDPAAPTIDERTRDESWSSSARLAFARSAVAALRDLHNGSGDHALVHRNLTPRTILVKHDNSALLTGFERTKIPSEITVASAQPPPDSDPGTLAPEIRTHGLTVADQRSDIYSLCASLALLFRGRSDALSESARNLLALGTANAPELRHSLQDIDGAMAELSGQSVAPTPAPPARFWTEDQVIRFRDRDYRIVARLGSGGVGATFKVVEIDRATKEELGTYVAKVGHHPETGPKVLHAYSLARPHLGRHSGLSAIFEIAKEWQDNTFTALMTWIEGTPLREFVEIFPLLAEDQQEPSAEALAIRWLRAACEALNVLHRNGLVHGDVSPRNMIVSGTDLVLTDYDFVSRIGDPVRAPATLLYCSPSYLTSDPVAASDDIYGLAASFFHIFFNREPFQHGGQTSKERGLNWIGLDRVSAPVLANFLDRATSPNRAERFPSTVDALVALNTSSTAVATGSSILDHGTSTSLENHNGDLTPALRQEQIDWLRFLLQSYPGSPRWGNRETRGLDTDFAESTYVETPLEEALYQDLIQRRARLVVLCGNAGDGKTALLQHLAVRLGLGPHSSAQRILEGVTTCGLTVRMNLDGSAAWNGRSADLILDEFLNPFQQGPPQDDLAHILAINDGRLLEWIESRDSTPLMEDLYDALEREAVMEDSHIRFVNLNQRSLVGNIQLAAKTVDTEFLDRLINQLYGGDRAGSIWSPCQSCQAREYCEVYRATRLFGPADIPFSEPESARTFARQRLYEALQAVHLRGEIHVTMRELRAGLVYALFGTHFCSDYHDGQAGNALPFWDRVFSPESPDRQGEVLRELARFDPALEAHPQLDRYLLSPPPADGTKSAPHYSSLPLESARRRAFFEWRPDQIKEITGTKHALGLARGNNLSLFRSIAFSDDGTNQQICERLCRGISKLEDLPLQALDRPGVVPLRITPRTPTETTFWVEKPITAFTLKADLPAAKRLDRLHRQAFLTYQYRSGETEQLRLGAELFHLLLELSDGYQLGDVSTDDTFAHLSIFVQRLIREDERELLAWNPMRDDAVFKVGTRIVELRPASHQQMVLSVLGKGV